MTGVRWHHRQWAVMAVPLDSWHFIPRFMRHLRREPTISSRTSMATIVPCPSIPKSSRYVHAVRSIQVITPLNIDSRIFFIRGTLFHLERAHTYVLHCFTAFLRLSRIHTGIVNIRIDRIIILFLSFLISWLFSFFMFL